MKNNEGYIEFITSESYKNQLDIWFKVYNITYEKIELYYDFFISLLNLVDETYLGSDVLKNENDIQNHFAWCFNEVINQFEKEKIYFKPQGTHFEYLWLFLYDAYYMNKNEDRVTQITNFFDNFFDFSHRKTQLDLEMMTDMYKLLDQNLKKQK
jgi:hypothetical protein